MDAIHVVPLGTSSATPTRERNVSSLALFLDGRSLLFDCGEGTQYQLIRSPLRLGHLEAIFITHAHGDHLFGLPGLLATLSMQGRSAPLTVFAPRGIDHFVTAALQYSYLQLGYPYEIREVSAGEIMRTEGYSVHALPLDHRVPTFGYTIVESDRLGRFDVGRAHELGIPEGPIYALLQQGEDVILDDGRLVRSTDVVGPPRPGRRVAYCTDSAPCANAVDLARDSDLLIHEATYADDMEDEARLRKHCTARQAALIAVEAGARRLLLTHFSPRYSDTTVLLEEARAVFANVEVARELEAVRV